MPMGTAYLAASAFRMGEEWDRQISDLSEPWGRWHRVLGGELGGGMNSPALTLGRWGGRDTGGGGGVC